MPSPVTTLCQRCQRLLPLPASVCPHCAAPLPKEETCPICEQPGARESMIPANTRFSTAQYYHEKCLETLYAGFPKPTCRYCLQPLNLPLGDWQEFFSRAMGRTAWMCEHCGLRHPAETESCEACHLPILTRLGSVHIGQKSDEDGEITDLYAHPVCHQTRQAKAQDPAAESKGATQWWNFWKS